MLFIGSDCLNENSRPPPLALALKANKDSVAAVGNCTSWAVWFYFYIYCDTKEFCYIFTYFSILQVLTKINLDFFHIVNFNLCHTLCLGTKFKRI